MNTWRFWTYDDPEAHAAGAAGFWPMHVIVVSILGVVLTLLMPWWTGNSLLSAALVAPIHLATHAITYRPGMYARAPRLVSTVENFMNLALMTSYAVNAQRPHPLVWVLAAGFVVLVGLGGRPAVSFALAALLFPALGTLLRSALFGPAVDVADLAAPLGAGAVLAATYVFMTFIRAGQTIEVELRRRDEEARVVEAERQRIARELHDDVGATLAEINLWLGIAQRGANPEALATARERAGACSVRLREMLVPLREGKSTVMALVDAIESRLAGLAEAGDLDVTVSVDATVDRNASIDGVAAHSLQMFALEAASNAIRHGSARHFSVVVAVVDGALTLTASDDGAGFDLPQTIKSGRLLGLQQRATACGGRFSGSSTAGATTVQLAVPT